MIEVRLVFMSYMNTGKHFKSGFYTSADIREKDESSPESDVRPWLPYFPANVG